MGELRVTIDTGEGHSANRCNRYGHQQKTNIGTLFKAQLIFLKLSGGFPISTSSNVSLFYSLAIILFNRLIVVLVHTKYYVLVNQIPRATVQNVSVLAIATQLLLNACALTMLAAGIKHQKLIGIVLSKKLDPTYLGCDQFKRLDETDKMGGSKHVNAAKRLLLANLIATVASSMLREFSSWLYGKETNLTNKLPGPKWLHFNPELGVLANLPIMIVCFIQPAMDINQVYGLLYVALMVTSTITDMLHFARHQDHLKLDPEQLNPEYNGSYKRRQSITEARRPLLTTEMLIQTRDILLAFRHIVSFACVLVVLTELVRLMTISCLINGALASKRGTLVATFAFEYMRLSLTIITGRMGYYWIHREVKMLKRSIDQLNMFQVGEAGGSIDVIDEIEDGRMSATERVTIDRLTDCIGSLWPTDWFSLDFKSYLKNNLFVLTFVLTLDQLVEVGMHMRHS